MARFNHGGHMACLDFGQGTCFDARREWIACLFAIFASAPSEGCCEYAGRVVPESRSIRMSNTSTAACILLVASLLGAGTFAATSEQPPRTGGDPVAGLAVAAELEKSRGGTVGQVTGPVEKVADAKGNLHVPENYRAKYRFIGSWAVAADSGSGSKEMHTVYASPGAVEGYLKTGHFEDGAVLVIAHPGNPLWGDGWGWSWFDADKPLKTTSTDYHNDCMGCHVPATPTDFIYVQGYPSLKKK
jgi:Cytochrome P460